MSPEKIKISWEDVKQPKIDIKIQQSEIYARVQSHQEKIASQPLPLQNTKKSIWHNMVLSLAIFGFLGGLLGWFMVEKVLECCADEKFYHLMQKLYQNEISIEDLRKENNKYAEFFLKMNDGNISQEDTKKQIEKIRVQDNYFFYIFLGVCIALFISSSEAVLAKNSNLLIKTASIASVCALLGSAILASFIDELYRFLGGGNSEKEITQIFARTVGWGILGLFLGIAPGIAMKSIKKTLIGLLGGFIGGLLGGLFFDQICQYTKSGMQARFFGMTAVGAFTGMGIGLIENALKTGWLRVVSGIIAGKQFILYRNPTNIGSSPKCEIYLFKDSMVQPVHASIHLVPGGFMIESKNLAKTLVNEIPVTKQKLRNNDRIQIGNTIFSFQEKNKSDSEMARL